jgi:hypothetical protein
LISTANLLIAQAIAAQFDLPPALRKEALAFALPGTCISVRMSLKVGGRRMRIAAPFASALRGVRRDLLGNSAFDQAVFF